MQARNLVPDYSQIKNLSKLLEDGPQVIFIHVLGNLPHEQLNSVRVLEKMATVADEKLPINDEYEDELLNGMGERKLQAHKRNDPEIPC